MDEQNKNVEPQDPKAPKESTEATRETKGRRGLFRKVFRRTSGRHGWSDRQLKEQIVSVTWR